ncbi:peptidase inhibitor family I36 protein [Amycolatopsis sp. NPDC004625]|uniref:peptidase inhibitor family I36 protein n=1 Tax=Amycolatopsis sp. NPDC004625 TaxID=3154670 RepID=UPI0033BA2474
MSTKPRLLRGVLTVLGALLLVVANSSAPASAAARDGVCETGEICFYYYANYRGSLSDFTGSIDNYGTTQPSCYEFKTPGQDGAGACMKNNARSVRNLTGRAARIYFNSGYCGSYDTVAANSSRNLSVTYDNNASHQFSPYPVGCHSV